MEDKNAFLNPVLSPETLDVFFVRKSILNALSDQLNIFNGYLLDIGCGNMPYKSLLTNHPSCANYYIGLDIINFFYKPPDIYWDGYHIPLQSNFINCAMATEVLEHCPEPEIFLHEVNRILQPGGFLFFTVPFLWPLHDIPFDEFRYTPYSIKRIFTNSGFEQVKLRALGGWNASLAQMIGLWIRRKPMSPNLRKLISILALPFIQELIKRDKPPTDFNESSMITGVWGIAHKS